MKMVVICGMSDEKVRARLLPLVQIDSVKQVLLIRRKAFEMEKVKNYSPPMFIRWSLLLAEIFRILTLFFVCVKEKPSMIYAIYFIPHGIYAGLIGRLFHIPVVHELIGTDRPKVSKSKFFQKLLSQGKRIGVRGTESREQLIALGLPREKFFISNSVNILDFDLFKPTPMTKEYDLIYCGHMDQNKQVDIILDAFIAIQRDHPEITMVLVGDGPERQNLEEKVNRIGLNRQVFFVGKQPYQAIPDFLNKSRIFVMASAFEGLPVAMLEALSCGLPVVVPDIGDIRDIAFHEYNALLLKITNAEAITVAISHIINDDSLYDKLKAGAYETRRKFVETFTIADAQKTWKEIIEN